MALIYLSIAWIAGIFLGSIVDPPPVLLLSGLIPLSLLFILRHSRKAVIVASLCLFLLIGGVLLYRSSLPDINENHLSYYNDSGSVEIEGIVQDDPEVTDTTTRLQFNATRIRVNQDWKPVTGTALLFVPRYPDYAYGDRLRVTGELQTPPQLDDFNYEEYLAHRSIYSTMLYPGIAALDKGKGNIPLSGIYSFRKNLSEAIATLLPEPQASLAQGIMLGIRGTIPSPVRENFSRTGTAHILAISGLHLSIVAGILLSLGLWLFGRRHY